jgi:predicted DNA-binding ribbon-helix-helix protein
MKKRSITIDGHRTSISLEDEFWEGLKYIADQEQRSLIDVIKHIDEIRTTGLSSALRVYVLQHYQTKKNV